MFVLSDLYLRSCQPTLPESQLHELCLQVVSISMCETFFLQTLLVDVADGFKPDVMPYEHEFVQILIYRFGHQKGRLRTYPYLCTCICIKCKHVAFNIPFGLNVTCETQCHFLWYVCIIIGKHSEHLWSGVEIDTCNMGINT